MSLGCVYTGEEDADAKGMKGHGHVLEPFDYSGKVISGKSDYTQKLNHEALRVRKLKNGKNGGWVVDDREEDAIYEHDPVSVLPGIADAKAAALAKHGVTDVCHILMIEDDEDAWADLLAQPGFTKKTIRKWQQAAVFALDGYPPEVIDYRKFPNPYAARFGWRERGTVTTEDARFMPNQ